MTELHDLSNADVWTDDDLDSLRIAVLTEQERRWTLRTGRERFAQEAERFAEAVATEPPIDWIEGTVIGPGQTVTEDGVEWRNTSGAWLSVPPSTYPLGYQRTKAPADPVALFKAGEEVQPGDLRTYNGITYQCLQPHTTADHWTPDVAVSLWTVAVEPEAL